MSQLFSVFVGGSRCLFKKLEDQKKAFKIVHEIAHKFSFIVLN